VAAAPRIANEVQRFTTEADIQGQILVASFNEQKGLLLRVFLSTARNDCTTWAGTNSVLEKDVTQTQNLSYPRWI